MSGVFQCAVFQHNVFQTDCGDSSAVVSDVGGVGVYAKAWRDHWDEQRKRDLRTAVLLDRIRSSQEYIRLKRRLAMLEEHLADNHAWYVAEEINLKMDAIRDQIVQMEQAAKH
jgi:hypothetical protein